MSFYEVPRYPRVGSAEMPVVLELAAALAEWRDLPSEANLSDVTEVLLRQGLFDLNLSEEMNASIWLCRYAEECGFI